MSYSQTTIEMPKSFGGREVPVYFLTTWTQQKLYWIVMLKSSDRYWYIFIIHYSDDRPKIGNLLRCTILWTKEIFRKYKRRFYICCFWSPTLIWLLSIIRTCNFFTILSFISFLPYSSLHYLEHLKPEHKRFKWMRRCKKNMCICMKYDSMLHVNFLSIKL